MSEVHDGTRDVTMFFGTKAGEDSFVTLRVGKNLTLSYPVPYYPVPPLVPERFPPLTELVQSWSFGRIWSEVGRTVDMKSQFDFSEHRDEILVRELARRGLSDDQFLDLLRTAKPHRLTSRAGMVFSALRSTGKDAFLNSHFHAALDQYERMGPMATSAVETVFLFAGKSCSPRLEERSVRYLKSGIFQRGALSFISRCSSSEATLATLQAVPVPSDLVQEKEFVIREIKRRLGRH